MSSCSGFGPTVTHARDPLLSWRIAGNADWAGHACPRAEPVLRDRCCIPP